MTQSGMGTYGRIGDILVQSVHVEAPDGTAYRPGDEARLWFTVYNDGREPDTLSAVRTPVAADIQIRWDADCDGTFQVVPDLPLRPGGRVAVPSPAGVPAFDAYHGRLIDVNREILAGSSIPVTFAFARAGTLTLEALVQPSEPPRAEPTMRCQGPSVPPTDDPVAMR